MLNSSAAFSGPVPDGAKKTLSTNLCSEPFEPSLPEALEKAPRVVNCIRLAQKPYSVRIHSQEYKSDQKYEGLSEEEFTKICSVLVGIRKDTPPRIFVLEDETFIVNDRTWIEFNQGG